MKKITNAIALSLASRVARGESWEEVLTGTQFNPDQVADKLELMLSNSNKRSKSGKTVSETARINAEIAAILIDHLTSIEKATPRDLMPLDARLTSPQKVSAVLTNAINIGQVFREKLGKATYYTTDSEVAEQIAAERATRSRKKADDEEPSED